MKELEKNIKDEIIDLHDIFVNWFTGYIDKTDLQDKLFSRFDEDSKFITTKGESVDYNNLKTMFINGYGKMNKHFKIAISDVKLLNELGEYILVNYIEWQTNEANPKENDNYNARKTTLLITKKKPFKWLHIHETMLPKPNKIIEKWNS